MSKQTPMIEGDGRDIFIVIDGVRIAKRGSPVRASQDLGVARAWLERARHRGEPRDRGHLRRRQGSLITRHDAPATRAHIYTTNPTTTKNTTHTTPSPTTPHRSPRTIATTSSTSATRSTATERPRPPRPCPPRPYHRYVHRDGDRHGRVNRATSLSFRGCAAGRSRPRSSAEQGLRSFVSGAKRASSGPKLIFYQEVGSQQTAIS